MVDFQKIVEEAEQRKKDNEVINEISTILHNHNIEYVEDLVKALECKENLETKIHELKEANDLLSQKYQNEINYVINENSKLKQENQELKNELIPFKLWNEIQLDMIESMRGVCIHGFHIQYIKNSEKHFGSEMAIVRGSKLEELIKENNNHNTEVQKLKNEIKNLKDLYDDLHYIHYGNNDVGNCSCKMKNTTRQS